MVSEQLLSLVVFAIAMTFSPGSNNVLMASSGLQVGMRRSIPLGLGILLGIVVLLTVSSIGLASIVHGQPSLHLTMKAFGSAYLVWLGWKIAHAGTPQLSEVDAGHRYGFTTGLINTLLNPKGWTMALSAGAGYTALASSAPQRALVLSLVFCVLMVPNWALWCSSGRALSRALRTERHWELANATLGLLVIVSLVPMWLD